MLSNNRIDLQAYIYCTHIFGILSKEFQNPKSKIKNALIKIWQIG